MRVHLIEVIPIDEEDRKFPFVDALPIAGPMNETEMQGTKEKRGKQGGHKECVI